MDKASVRKLALVDLDASISVRLANIV